jgi:hypothetical protein
MTRRSVAVLALLAVPLTVATFEFNRLPVSEAERLHLHFDAVERELLAADVSQLTEAQRIARAMHIRRLREYADHGVFPRNTDHPGERVPYFIDRFGTRCAMAYLIEQSGAGEYVGRVATRMNNASIHEIAGDPALGGVLHAWLRDNGVSLREAARIQPAYSCEEFPELPSCERASDVTGYKIGAGALVLAGATTVAMNAIGPSQGRSGRTAGWLGMGVGALGIAFSFIAPEDEATQCSTSYCEVVGKAPWWAVATAGVGTASFLFGLYRVLDAPTQVARLTATPLVSPQGAAGVQLNFAF